MRTVSPGVRLIALVSWASPELRPPFLRAVDSRSGLSVRSLPSSAALLGGRRTRHKLRRQCRFLPFQSFDGAALP
eukprot:15106053-Alexandrium_andersonii.AAC.1